MSQQERLAERAERTGHPVRVGLVGAGQMGLALAAQLRRIPGMELSAVAASRAERAVAAVRASGREPVVDPDARRAREVVGDGGAVALSDADAVASLPLDVVVEATGVPEVGARVADGCLRAGTHVLMLNVETDVTIGRHLDALARANGVVYSVAHGDEPVAAKELYDLARDMAFDVVCAGKGKNNPLDPRATPDSLRAEATAKRMNPKMLCSFVDGTKTMVEMAALANATGMVPDVVGMHGPTVEVARLAEVFRPRSDGGVLGAAGRVDYAFGPAPGVFVIVTTDERIIAEEMRYLLMGDGPYWCLYRPFHLASIEVPRSIAMAVLDGRAALCPATSSAEVVTVAKRDLAAGEVVDGIGGDTVYGVTYPAGQAVDLLPLGLAAGARLVEPAPAGTAVTRAGAAVRPSLLADLRALQERRFPVEPTGPATGTPLPATV